MSSTGAAVSARPAPHRLGTYAAMGLHVALAAGTYVVGKFAADEFPEPAVLTALRAIVASALCLALSGWAIPRPRFTLLQWLEVAALGLVLVLNQYLFLRGLHDTVPAHPALIYALTPVGVLLLASAVERRRPPRAWAVGVPLALGGVLLVLRPWSGDAQLADVQRGDAFIAAGLVVWVVYTVWVRRLTRQADPRTVTVWTLALGTALFLPFVWEPLAATDFAALSPRAWAGIAWMGAITSTLMMLLWNSMLRSLDPVQVSICANAQPAATAALCALLAATGLPLPAQDLGPAYWAGTALVVAGVVTVQFRR